jgi:pyruvate dehydrogenase E2 component (dihydrolipoamide acetyltransferase)
MPSLGADMEFGTLVQWRVKPGTSLKRGEVVAEVETQKGVFEIDMREDAVVTELLVAEGTRVKVGATLAVLAPGARPAPDERPSVPSAPAKVAELPLAQAPLVRHEKEAEPAPVPRRPHVSPLARRVAEELGVDLSTVQGTGEGGAIMRADVETAAGRVPPVTPIAPPTVGMREAIAAAMARSKREIPHYYVSEDMELSAAMNWLTATNTGRSVTDRILPVALLLKGVARALTRFPELNGHFVDNTFRPSSHVHPGVAITLRGGGLVAPAIHDADRLSIPDLMAALADLVRRARQGGLRSSEIMDPTITVSNLGDEGVRTVFGVITPPQVAVVGFGAIEDRPWAEHGLIGARPVLTVTLSADHRVSDGWRGARFLRELRRLLGKPEEL